MIETDSAKIAALRRFFIQFDTAGVAFSGGVDSTLVLCLAFEQLHDRVVAITAVSESLPSGELDQARDLARRIGAADTCR